jgi:hypothetical protein
VACGQHCRRARGMPSCGRPASQAFFERRSTPIAASRVFVPLALQMRLPPSRGSSRECPTGDGSRQVPGPLGWEREARDARGRSDARAAGGRSDLIDSISIRTRATLRIQLRSAEVHAQERRGFLLHRHSERLSEIPNRFNARLPIPSSARDCGVGQCRVCLANPVPVDMR